MVLSENTRPLFVTPFGHLPLTCIDRSWEIYSSHLASICIGKSLWDVWFSKPPWVIKLLIQAKLNVRCDHRELKSKPVLHVWSWLFPSCLSLVFTSPGMWTWRKCHNITVQGHVWHWWKTRHPHSVSQGPIVSDFQIHESHEKMRVSVLSGGSVWWLRRKTDIHQVGESMSDSWGSRSNLDSGY